MIQKNKHYKMHSQRLACYKVQQRKTYNSMDPHHLHVPQADMLVADSKPESVPYLSSEQPATVKTLQPKIGQNHWNGSGKWYLWTHKRQTPNSYMHIWLVEFKAILRKANFILSLQNISSTTKYETHPWNASKVSKYPCSPIKFYYEIGMKRFSDNFLA